MPDLTAVGGLLAPSGEDARRILATRLFTEGLRALDRGNRAGARQLFESSLAEDSTNSLAAYYVAAANDDFAAYPRLFARAVRLAMHDTDERRLLVQGLAAFASDEPRAAAIAETLAIRYPRNADGQLLVGKTRIQRGDFVGAVGPLRQAIVLDSVALRSDAMRCVACEAYSELAGAYDSADSAAAAERVAREWIAARPRSGAAWDRLAYRLEVRGAWDEARAALDRKAAIEGTGERDLGHAAEALMRAGRYREADALLLPRLATAALDRRADVLWLLTISYRNQGRLGEALAAAREFRRLAPRLSDEGAGTVLQGYLEALVLMDGGAPERAAALFDSIAHQTLVRSSVARQGRHMATNHAHRATALALAGDTLALRALVDTVRVEGARSGYARDQRLHHYVRGLLLEARGDHAGALRAYRASMYSPLGGWVRSNVAYARTAMRLGRPRDAVWALGGAIRGPFGASGLWYSRPEIHRLLANAWSAAGRPDSAAVHRAAAGPSRPANATAAR